MIVAIGTLIGAVIIIVVVSLVLIFSNPPGAPTMTELKKPREWEKIHRLYAIYPEGWDADDKDFEEPITEDEWKKRMSSSAVITQEQIDDLEPDSYK